MNNDFNDLLQDALDMPYEEKVNLTKEAVDKLYNVLIENNKDEAMPDMLKIFGYFIKLDNIIAFDEIQLLIDSMGLTISGQQLNLYFKDMDFEEAVSTLMKTGKFIPSACNKFVRTSLLREHSIIFEKGLISEDIEWTYQIMQYAKDLKGFDIPFYGYRRREGSITHSLKPKTINDLLYVIEKWSSIILSNDMSENLKFQLLGYLNYQYCIANGQVCRISKEERINFEPRFDALKWLLKYDINKKTHMVLTFSKLFGLKNIRRILRFYIWLKNKGLKFQ